MMNEPAYRTDQEVGAYIKELRSRRGLSQDDLGRLLGVPQSTVSRIETGDRAIGGRELAALSREFGVTTSELLEREAAVPAFLRVGEGDGEGVQESLRIFRACIDEFHGIETLVR
jgi:transcriptional regulator with XRE-family HTH domain